MIYSDAVGFHFFVQSVRDRKTKKGGVKKIIEAGFVLTVTPVQVGHQIARLPAAVKRD